MPYKYNAITGELDLTDTDAAGAGAILSVLTDSGAPAVDPDISGQIQLLGGEGIDVTGTGPLNVATIAGEDATTTNKGISELATDAEAIAGVLTDNHVINPSSLNAKLGSQALNGIPYGAGVSSAINWTVAMTDGELLIGATGGAPSPANLTSTGGTVVITNGANSINLEAAAGASDTFTTDVGNATPLADVLNILGSSTITTSGAGNTVTVGPSSEGYPITKYVVDASGDTAYSTFQSAVDAATLAGGNTLIEVRAGTYIENVIFDSSIVVKGVIGTLGVVSGTRLIGTHTPPATGHLSLSGITFESATDVFNSAAAGSATLYIEDAVFEITNGYVFNLPNWTGLLNMNNFGENSTNNGFVNNSGGATIFTNNGQVGAGVVNSMIANGDVRLDLTFLGCPSNISSGTMFINFALFSQTMTISGDATGDIILGDFFTGVNPAINITSTNPVNLKQTSIESTAVDVITGTGTIGFNSVNFVSSNGIANTVTQILTSVLKAGEIHAENIQNMMFSGRLEWGGAGAYYSLAATNFTLERAGTGYVKSKLVTWAGSQSTGALSVGNTHYIYVDDTGTIWSTTTRSLALFQNNIVLFEVLVDPNSVVSVVREDHPYDFSTSISEWAHDVIGSVIANKNNGANIALNGTKGIQINGADELEDHGLETNIPDSAAAAVDFTFMFTNGAGKWTIDSTANTFASEYNNGGVVAALGGNKFGVFRLYVSKDDLNTSTPNYYAVLDVAQYNNLTAAQTAVASGSTAAQSAELAAIELAQLGFVIKSESTDTIVDVIIEKATGGGGTSIVSPSIASLVVTDTSNFNGWLSAADTTVQASLETLDDVGLTVTPEHGVLLAGASLAIASTAVGATGTVLIGNTGADPSFSAAPTVTTLTATTVNAITLDTNVAAAGVTLAGTSLVADGTDANINIPITPKGTGVLQTAAIGNAANTKHIVISAAGEVTKPLQPAFLAYLNATVTNVTGNGLGYVLGTTALTEVYDQNSDFNTNGTFTAPATGKYALTGFIEITDCTTGTGASIQITTSNRNYFSSDRRSASAFNENGSMTCYADMDAGDTATVTVFGWGDAGNTQDVLGHATNVWTGFCGHLIC